MKKVFIYISTIALFLLMSACSNRTAEVAEVSNQSQKEYEETEKVESSMSESKQQVQTVRVFVNGNTYTAVLYDNNTATEFLSRLPLTIEMNPMNGNEKYYYMDETLPTDASIPDSIKTGDLMLFGSDCLVLFHDDFTTSYSYTPIGYLTNVNDLADVLGSGSVEVTFEITNE